ncbi:putative porin [Galbibacter sp. EGI 63066]|uniref:putative porin n=1 Tax=Galbibacter sp. EGI 63066 TaxID=2993559 RepID=UPI0022497EF7|nr:putative porin [Galbibacter sp. EGI 63066]MCX2679444.1 putative porin [Galbibacter sp. EGI 63066]
MLVFFAFGIGFTNAQDKPIPELDKDTVPEVVNDTTLVAAQKRKQPKKKKGKDGEFPIEDYKIISYARDTTHFDTTLTIQKEYKYNYLRRDDFELLPFANVGQTYNVLGVRVKESSFYPRMGQTAKHNNYMEVEDIKYYRVPTPTTELFYKTVMEQGQILDAMITLNTSPQLNMSIAYKGMRSLGKYKNILSSTGNFRFTTSYQTKNGRYRMRLHYAAQDILNEENGGLAVPEQFTGEDDEFDDRSRIDVKFEDAENFLLGKRYFLDHEFFIAKQQDSLKNYGLSLGHILTHETKTYEYRQNGANAYFGDAYQTSNLNDKAKLRTTTHQLNLNYSNKITGKATFLVNYYKYNYFFNSLVISEEDVITNQLRDNEISLGGKWSKRIGGFSLAGDFTQNIVGDMGGTTFNGKMEYQLKDNLNVNASLHSSSRMPNFNYLLYQSDYKEYNWQNTENFEKQKIYTIQGAISHKKWGSVDVAYTVMDKYAYFKERIDQGDSPSTTEDDVQYVDPMQFQGSINSMKVKFSNDLHFLRRWGLANTVMFQSVSQSENILNVPEIVTRNTLYYSNHLFDKALYLQTGVTVRYFSKYYMNSYSPVLGELLIQDREEIGEFPMMDFFINAKVRRTRIYLKAEHLNSFFSENNYYSAPNNPYRDFIIRFGVVWNFFS